jgi:hypothetical protein
MSANIQETIIAFSKTAQTAVGTASTDVIRVNTISADLADVEPIVEDDADEIGKGHEFAEESFLTSWKVARKIEVYNSAEMLAIAAAFGLGNGNAGTYTPIDPTTNINGIDMPLMTFYEGIRPNAASPVLDRALLDMVVDKFTMELKSGPGRANSKLSIELKGSGKKTEPSGLIFPTKTPVHPPAVRIRDLLDQRREPRHVQELRFVRSVVGQQHAGRILPRFRFPDARRRHHRRRDGPHGIRQTHVHVEVRRPLRNGSTQLTVLSAQTSGTAVMGLSGGTGFDATITASQTRIKAAKIDNSDGIVTVAVEVSCQVPIGGDLTDYLTIAVSNTLGTLGR